MQEGWSQARLIAAMRRTALEQGIVLPDDCSLKTNLSRWENGRVIPGPEYRKVLRAVFGMTDHELGFPGGAREAGSAGLPVSEEALGYFEEMFHQHVRADCALGPRIVLDTVEHQAAALAAWTRPSPDALLPKVLSLACRYQELLGWLYQDVGRVGDAMIATERALGFARQGGDRESLAYLLMRQSNIATDGGQRREALALADAALQHVDLGSGGSMAAVVLRQKANAHAALRDPSGCQAAIDQAFELVDSGEDSPTAVLLSGYCTPDYLAMEAAACWIDLDRPEAALGAFEQRRQQWNEASRRDHGLALAREALARAHAGDVDGACQMGAQAVAAAHSTGSQRTIRALRQLRPRLRQWPHHDQAADLSSAIANLVGAVA